MSDFNSSLPIRTETNGDAAVKVVDGTITSRQLTVNADGSINVTDNGASITVDAVNLDIRDLVFASDKVDTSGSTVALDSTTLAALESITVQNGAGAAAVNIQDGGNSITVDAVDLDIRDLTHVSDSVKVGDGTDLLAVNADGSINSVVTATNLDIRDLTHVSDSIKIGDGTDFLAVNADGSINVVAQDDSGTEIVNYDTSAAIAAGASDNHDWTSAAASKLYQVYASGSEKMKIEIQIETGSATNTFNTVAVAFNSTATPNMDVTLSKYAVVPNGARVRVIRTNRGNQAQDVYSTIVAIQG